ncbi:MULTISPECIES: pyridoxal 5'-phosphate synthase [unclassified Arthrobacter]|uniref:pyridoxine/pyridoxamine 5'-phosphate oxidase n=1 Tax=unclassified Arthrobacter TaxID=235627 RepID=UPI0014913BFC|nr:MULTISPECIES: pyridoxal 5'-phosphate synthase [unclassified Arthrobacter]MBE0009994.1 pyridoxamine 5'-phosphate oxidase [Arthrobacter sp. AET 35A]NOJ63833.1 pyridoxamine 5'-phosphate oxidase [Arthrobacter sp. 147(2020)]
MSEHQSMRDLLRGVPAFPDTLPAFDPAAAPESPTDLFLEWLAAAVEDGVAAPHALTLATVDRDGMPDARVVILKDVDNFGFSFASSSDSPKGRQLENAPAAALNLFWPTVGRQIRIRGAVRPAGTGENDADFRRRHPVARALVLAGEQSSVLRSREELDDAVATQVQRLEGDGPTPGSVTWTVYTLSPDSVEFWQADPERRHLRLRYARDGAGWSRTLLWP